MSGKENEALAYSCPSCGGALRFDPETGKLKCDFCESLFTTEEVEKRFGEKEATAEASQSEDEMRAYSCSTCGAELMTDPNTAVIKCPYCGNNTIATAQFAGNIRPEFVVPFAFTKKQAMEKYKDYHGRGLKKLLLPGSFGSKSHVEEIQGVYVPFWLFNGKVDIDGTFEASDSRTQGDYKITKYYEVKRAGTMDFKRVPADASKRMPDDLMDSIEPYDFKALKPFSMSYLPGFLAERFDVNEADDEARMNKRVKETIHSMTVKTISHSDVTDRNVNIDVTLGKTEYALLPAWVLTTKWQDKNWLFAMNGQTGAFTGDLPISKGKYVALLLLSFLIFFILGSLIMGATVGAILGSVVAIIAGMIAYGGMKPVGEASNADKYMENKINLTVKEEKFLREEKHKVK
ncbi:MAG: hypothetical protein K5985_10310 [Lachnospiraceae bacterium]|nr:hypothetical protein [Lachnospiraceae bacterium]